MIVRVCRLLSLVTPIFVLASLTVAELKPTPQDELEWKDFRPILNATFPIERGMGSYVGYRYSHVEVPGELEYSFVIGFRPLANALGVGRTLSGDIQIADTTSIYEQLRALHLQHPEKPLDELRASLKVQSFRVTEAACPALRARFEKFKNLRFTPPDETIGIDRPFHEFRIDGFPGKMDVELLDQKHPLVLWASETRRELGLCVSNASAPIVPKH